MYITAACVLHNMCITNHEEHERIVMVDEDPNRNAGGNARRERAVRREALLQELWNARQNQEKQCDTKVAVIYIGNA